MEALVAVVLRHVPLPEYNGTTTIDGWLETTERTLRRGGVPVEEWVTAAVAYVEGYTRLQTPTEIRQWEPWKLEMQ